MWFNIIDYTGSATRNFADPAFDGTPTRITQEEIDTQGNTTDTDIVDETPAEYDIDECGVPQDSDEGGGSILEPPGGGPPRKYYFDGGSVRIVAHLVYELDPDGKQLQVVRYTDYAAHQVRSICRTAPELRTRWADPIQRAEIIQQLEERGISFTELADIAKQPNADPFDLLCFFAFNAPLKTRRERALQLKQSRKDFFEQFGTEARQILEELLEKYAEHGDAQFVLPEVLKVPPISSHGQIGDITLLFGGADQLRNAVADLQRFLYAA